MHFQTPTSSSRFNPQSWRCLLCWMLCVCVWRGPIPVLHSHSLAIADLGANESLAEHAVHFHADHLGEPETGLHLHLLLLTPCEGSLLCPSLENSHDIVPEVALLCTDIGKELSVDRLEYKQVAQLDGTFSDSTRKPHPSGSQENTFAISLLSQSSFVSCFGVALI